MTTKEKAEELYNKMLPEHGVVFKSQAKKCALVAVDNAMDALRFLPYGLDYLQQIDYWEGVKQEIEKL
jgi:hypothetical protein